MKIDNWNNCPICLEKLVEVKNFKKCAGCGREFYDNPILATGMIIWNSKGQIMLTKRKKDPAKGKFSFPGGFVDVGESAEDAVKREIEEELKINIDVFRYSISSVNNYLYKNSHYNMLDLLFEVELSNDIIKKIKPSDDVEEIHFFNLNEIKDDILGFESTKKVIDFLKQRKN